ncbi:uncharacterized protein LOC105012266 isoform X2 [Esox lucius]|uniref:Ig-like domain-containing protein n=2 Tax=Esox lucius TaxID=8010 RepID=A0A3P8XQC6_ESOLU|nr:uncharacterized protein LOC105012266 isoform X2 [Esox lucius]
MYLGDKDVLFLSISELTPGILILGNPKMSLVITMLFLAIPCACYSKSEKYFELDCKQEVSGVNGQQSLLECIVKCREDTVTIIGVNWKKMGKVLLGYYKGKTDVSPGFQFAVPGWNKSSNVSLLLTNTKMEDMGEYECEVLTDLGHDKNTVSLRVTAMNTTPTMNSSPENNIKETIYCNSTDSAEEKMIWWFDEDSKNLTDRSELVAQKKDNGRFSISSKLTVRKDISKHYTCNVLSINGDVERTVSFEPRSRTKDTAAPPRRISMSVIIVIVASSLFFLFLFFMFCFFIRRCSRQRPCVYARSPTSAT